MSVQLRQFAGFLGLPHGVSTRHGGVSDGDFASLNVGYGTADVEEHVAANRQRLVDALGVDSERVVAGSLTHGSEVTVFRKDAPATDKRVPVRPGSTRTARFFLSDGVVSNVPDLYVLLTFADCTPLLFYDPVREVMGAAHAGWRGTAAGIGPATVDAMTREFGTDPSDVRVGIGPAIGACCYQVRHDVTETFQRHGQKPVMNGYHLDLRATNERQLRAVGVRHVEVDPLCTACATDVLYSHRGEGGRTGRFALVAGLPGR